MTRRNYLLILILGGFFLLSSGTQSNAKINSLHKPLSKTPIGRSMEYLVDKKDTLTISDIQNKKTRIAN